MLIGGLARCTTDAAPTLAALIAGLSPAIATVLRRQRPPAAATRPPTSAGRSDSIRRAARPPRIGGGGDRIPSTLRAIFGRHGLLPEGLDR
jgi:hypothetical protein